MLYITNDKRYFYPRRTTLNFRVTGTFTCFMKLQEFPFDKQLCVMELESCKLSRLFTKTRVPVCMCRQVGSDAIKYWVIPHINHYLCAVSQYGNPFYIADVVQLHGERKHHTSLYRYPLHIYIVCWYKTLYQVEPIVWTNITTSGDI
jgi:hypothetical protein